MAEYGDTTDQDCLFSSEVEYIMPGGLEERADEQDSGPQDEIADGALAPRRMKTCEDGNKVKELKLIAPEPATFCLWSGY